MNLWDEWRKNYAEFSFQDQQSFYSQLNGKSCKFYSISFMKYVLSALQSFKGTIIELGGQYGELAQDCLSQNSTIQSWQNYEINPNTMRTICKDPRYSIHILSTYFWDLQPLPQGDVFIASHVLEHISLNHLNCLLDRLTYPRILIEVPLPDITPIWMHYDGSHILELAFHQLIDCFNKHHYEIKTQTERMIDFERRC